MTDAPPSPARAIPPLVSTRGLVACSLAIVATAGLFAAAPGLDLEAAALFYTGDNAFIGHGAWGDGLRRVFYWTPFAVFVLFVGLYLLRKSRLPVPWAPNGRGVAFLALSLALGPGLLVNTLLKEHSHRPRPIHVVEFGGTLPFRPFYRFDGDCRRNCSFVSGEGSSAFWCVAPALLAPPGLGPPALAGALAFAVGAGLLRMAFGGHFLSDTIFAALFTWLVVIATWRAVLGRTDERAVRSGGIAGSKR